jgi:hypothetical protein
MVEWRPQVCHVGGAAGNLKGARDPGSHRPASGVEAHVRQQAGVALAAARIACHTSRPRCFRWLADNAGSELFKPAPNDYLQAWPVSRRVNSSRAPGDDPTLIDRVAA